jgi:hypothetical protein
MKNILVLALFVLLTASSAHAQVNPFETTEQSRQRHSYERYQQYKDNDYQAPLGGYKEKLGDPAPRWTDRPGYNEPNRYYYNDRYKDQD